MSRPEQIAEFPLRWLYVDFNSYFASVEQQEHPELRGKPVAVVPVMSDATCAIAASYEAKAFGIKTGTPIYEAKKRCPDLICVHGKHDMYVQYHQRLCEEISNHLPIAAVCSIDEMACRLMDNENSPEVIARIAFSIKRGIAEHVGEYIRCSIGVSTNRYLAKIATDMQKPDGFTILRHSDLPSKLLTLSLRDLPGVGYNMEKRLHRAGIFTMEHLLSLSRQQLRQVWENLWGEWIWYALRGVEMPEQVTHRSTVGHSHVMAPELRAPAQARHVARRLTMKAASRLRRMEYYATTLTFSARLENGLRWRADARCYRAQDNFTFLRLLEGLWREMLADAGAARIKKLSVALHGLVPEHTIAPELFDSINKDSIAEQKKSERVSDAIDLLNQRYGRDTVSIGMLPAQGRSFSGTKVAFTRIPDLQEFSE